MCAHHAGSNPTAAFAHACHSSSRDSAGVGAGRRCGSVLTGAAAATACSDAGVTTGRSTWTAQRGGPASLPPPPPLPPSQPRAVPPPCPPSSGGSQNAPGGRFLDMMCVSSVSACVGCTARHTSASTSSPTPLTQPCVLTTIGGGAPPPPQPVCACQLSSDRTAETYSSGSPCALVSPR
eukprot:351207-Chlamydomonas_euryale.AAC.1